MMFTQSMDVSVIDMENGLPTKIEVSGQIFERKDVTRKTEVVKQPDTTPCWDCRDYVDGSPSPTCPKCHGYGYY